MVYQVSGYPNYDDSMTEVVSSSPLSAKYGKSPYSEQTKPSLSNKEFKESHKMLLCILRLKTKNEESIFII